MPRPKKTDSIQDASGADIEQFGTIFDHMGVKQPNEPQPQAKPTPEVDVSALMQKIAGLEGTLNAIASRPAPAQAPVYTPPAAQTPQKWDWADPVTEPDAFAATLGQYTTYVIEQRDAAQRAEQEKVRAQSQKANALWADFSSQYKEYAEKGDQIGYAYRRVADRLAENGIDPLDYGTVNKPALFQQVVDEYTKVFGPIKPTQSSDDDDNSRTAGIFGGFESGGKPAEGKEAPGDMIKDLKDMQKAMGIF